MICFMCCVQVLFALTILCTQIPICAVLLIIMYTTWMCYKCRSDQILNYILKFYMRQHTIPANPIGPLWLDVQESYCFHWIFLIILSQFSSPSTMNLSAYFLRDYWTDPNETFQTQVFICMCRYATNMFHCNQTIMSLPGMDSNEILHT